MNLDKIAAQMRVRPPFEAIDLGFLLARHFARPLWAAWFAILGPIFVIILGVSYYAHAFWMPFLLLWWLKPLYARVPLLVLSRGFFGSTPTHAQTMQAFPRSARRLYTLWQLTLGRLNPALGFSMIVNDLERGTFKQNRQRSRILRKGPIDFTVQLLLLTSLCCQLLFFVASIAFFSLVQPPTLDVDTSDFLIDLLDGYTVPYTFKFFLLVSYIIALTLIEPFFIAGNFGLYISRRIELEGWDIELTFRKLAARIQARNEISTLKNTALLLLATGLSALCWLVPAPGHAHQETASDTVQSPPMDTVILMPDNLKEAREQQPENVQDIPIYTPPADSRPKAHIQSILAQPEFGESKTQKSWKLRDDFNLLDRFKDKKFDLSGAPSPPKFTTLITVLAWSLATLLTLFIAYFIVRHLQRRTHDNPRAPKNTFEQDWQQLFEDHGIDRETTRNLPEDIITHARAAHTAGDDITALTLLYAGMLRALQRDFGLQLDPGLTAYECALVVRKHNGPHELVTRISNAWTARVFAHRTLDEHNFENLLQHWQTTFTARRPS